MRTRAKQKHVASDRARRENVQKHILFHCLYGFQGLKQLYCVMDYLRYKYFGSPFSMIWETSPWISGWA